MKEEKEGGRREKRERGERCARERVFFFFFCKDLDLDHMSLFFPPSSTSPQALKKKQCPEPERPRRRCTPPVSRPERVRTVSLGTSARAAGERRRGAARRGKLLRRKGKRSSSASLSPSGAFFPLTFFYLQPSLSKPTEAAATREEKYGEHPGTVSALLF